MTELKTGVIVQARMGSSRLPGKVLKQLQGRPVLEWIIRRIAACHHVDVTVIATTNEAQDQPIVDLCKRFDVDVFRGSENDVLDRYYQAAVLHKLDLIVRITADCPLTDPVLVDEVIQAYLSATDKDIDFVSNNLVRRYPRGTDVALVTFTALEKAWKEATATYERVHVMPYIRQHPEKFKLLGVESSLDRGQMRWTVDTPEDFAFVSELYRRIDPEKDFSWKHVLTVLEKQPELLEINRHVKQKQLDEL